MCCVQLRVAVFTNIYSALLQTNFGVQWAGDLFSKSPLLPSLAPPSLSFYLSPSLPFFLPPCLFSSLPLSLPPYLPVCLPSLRQSFTQEEPVSPTRLGHGRHTAGGPVLSRVSLSSLFSLSPFLPFFLVLTPLLHCTWAVNSIT